MLRWLAICLATLTAACGPTDPEDDGFCTARDIDTTVPPSEARAVVAGDRVSGAFTPWMDGGDATLVFGFQGGFMVTPVLQVEARDEMVGEGQCWIVSIDNRIARGPAVVDYSDAHTFFPAGDGYVYSDSILDFLGDDDTGLAGNELTLEVTVRGPTFEATSSVTVTLVPQT